MPSVLETELVIVQEPPRTAPGGPNGGGPRDFDPGDRGGGGDGDGGGPEGDRSPNSQAAALFGMRVMLVSITVLFVTIGVIYFARSQSPVNWQRIRVPGLLWVSTALLIASSWTLETARGNFFRTRYYAYARWLSVTVGLGIGFLMSQLFALRELVDQGFFLRRNPHSSLFYVVTGAHAIHLFGGMAALFYLSVWAAGHPTPSAADVRRQRGRSSITALYWHFLDALWVALFLCLLFWP
jgi:cytochrome c oxidase subunit 3